MAAALLSGGIAFAQGELDAYRYSQRDMNGTARYLSMGGAFGALGGDISVLSNNPAGLGIYRSSEVVTTLSVSSVKAKSNWAGSQSDATKTKFNFDNIAYVGYFPTGNDEGVVGWNIGFSYNRLKNYSRSYRMSMTGSTGSSMADYIAARANLGGLTPDLINEETDGNGNIVYDPYNKVGDWLSVIGGNTGFMNYRNGQYQSAFPASSYQHSLTEMLVSESGAIDQYALAFGMNISEFLLLGATVSITDLNYDLSSYYAEDYNKHTDFTSYMELMNGLSTDGTGYNVNVGAILRPVDFLRIGVAYNSPTWYKMIMRKVLQTYRIIRKRFLILHPGMPLPIINSAHRINGFSVLRRYSDKPLC